MSMMAAAVLDRMGTYGQIGWIGRFNTKSPPGCTAIVLMLLILAQVHGKYYTAYSTKLQYQNAVSKYNEFSANLLVLNAVLEFNGLS